MAGTVTTGGRQELVPHGMSRWPIDWRSNASGVVSETINFPGGLIKRVTFWPDPDFQPTDNYAVTLKDEEGVDILGGRGASVDSDAASSIVPLVNSSTDAFPFAVGKGWLYLAISGAGSEKRGRIVLHF